MPPASVSSVRSADSISGLASLRRFRLRVRHSLTLAALADQLSTERRGQGDLNATLTILVLHPLTISRAWRGREDVLRAACRFRFVAPAGVGAVVAVLAAAYAFAQPATRSRRGLRPAFEDTEDSSRARETPRTRAQARHATGAGDAAGFRQSAINQPPSFGNPPGSGASKTGFRFDQHETRVRRQACARARARSRSSGATQAGAALAHARLGASATDGLPAQRRRTTKARRRRTTAKPVVRHAGAAPPRNPLVRIPDGTATGGIAGTVNTAQLTHRHGDAAAPAHRRGGRRVRAARPARRRVPGLARRRSDRRLRHQSGAHAERARLVVRHGLARTAREVRLAAPRGDRDLARQLHGLRPDAGARPAELRRQGHGPARRDAQHRADRRGHV